MVAPTGRESFDSVGEGVTINTSNTLFTSVNGTGGHVALSAAACRGTRGVRFSGSAVSSWVGYTITANGTMSAEAYFKYRTADKPSSDMTMLQVRNSTGGMAVVAWLTTGIIRLLNGASTNIRNLNSNTELADGNYRLQITAVKGTTTANGRILLRLDNLISGAVVENYDSGTTTNTGTTDMTEIRWGKTNAGGIATVDMDECAWLSGSTAAIDLPVSNEPPTARAGNDQIVEPYIVVTLNGTASTDPEGNALTYSWSQTAGTTVSLSSSTSSAPTFTSPGTLAGTVLTFQLTVSDGTNTGVDTVDISVLSVTERAIVGGVEVPLRLTSV